MRECEVESCDREHYAKGWCKRHYYRNRAHGHPTDGGTQISRHDRFRDGKKICTRCREWLDPSEFSTPERTWCRTCRRCARYRMSKQDHRAMLDAQKGRCLICQTRPATHIDHDHKCCPMTDNQRRTCGKCTRGILCKHCNASLGVFMDDTNMLKRAIDYINNGGKIL